MKASKISLDSAKSDKLFYVVANVVVFRESDKRCLILKRGDDEKAHPGRYAFPGGKLEWADLDLEHPTRVNGDILDFENAIEDLLEREAFEEGGVKIETKGIKYINSVAYVRPDGIPSILIKFAAAYKSGEAKIEKGAFTDFAWVNAEEILAYDCVDGVQEEARQVAELFA